MNTLFDFDQFELKATEKNSVTNGMTSRSQKVKLKVRFENRLKTNQVAKVIYELPLTDESIHIVSNGNFDYFTIIPRIIELAENNCDLFYFSTWTMSHENVMQILDMFDSGVFKNINALTGEYFRSRETAVYSILEQGIEKRGQKLFSNKNHTKVTLLKIGTDHYVIEGSANFTANPRIENFVLTNNEDLFNFHKEWMELISKNHV